ncbi:unnamed protein product [Closterium sp. NIES-53]
MVDRLPELRKRTAPALQKGDLPTQQVDDVPTLQQSDCPALPRRRQQCAHLQMRANDWPDLHRCAFVGCCLCLTSHVDFGIPPQSRLCHRDLDDVCVLPQNSPSRLPGRPGQPQVPPVDHWVLLVDHQVSLVDHSSRRVTLWSTDCSIDLPVELPLLADDPPVAQASQLQLSSSLVDSNTTAVPCSSTKPVKQLSHCGWSAATPVHPTKSSALPKRGRGQHFTPVN